MENGTHKPEDFGKRLRTLRETAGLTQKELAGSRFSPAYISTLESGRRSPSAAALIFLSERLGTDLSNIVFPGGSELSEALEQLPDEAPQAARLLEDILRSVARAQDPLLKADVSRLVARSRLDDAPDVAEQLLHSALRIYREAPVTEGARGLGSALFLLGEVALKRGQSDKALALYREAAAVLAGDGTFP